ncbi:c-type cytochrome, partial [Escherichia coli]|nr:c-type cytochrome [Escherichia coli]
MAQAFVIHVTISTITISNKKRLGEAMKRVMIGAVAALTMLSGQALAGDAAAGQAKAAVCAACHGADGNATIPGYPNLKGQNEQYIVSSIKAYKNKERNG